MQRTVLTFGAISFLSLMVSPLGAQVQDDALARKLINSQGCKACHTLEGDGGNLAKSFKDISASLTRAEIQRQLVNPEQRHGNDNIADFGHLSEEEIEALVNFIQTMATAD